MNRAVAIVGLGYVGLPLAELYLDQGFDIIGIDLDERKLQMLHQGESYIADVPNEKINAFTKSGRLAATSDFSKLRSAEAIIICVPTPLNENQVPDLSYLVDAANRIQEHLRPGQLITLESSTYPGTTKEVLVPLLQKSGLEVGVDIFIGFSPERVDPGNKQFPLPSIPKVVSGITDLCAERTEQLYAQVFHKVVKVSSTDTAEMTKLLENTFRFVNISFINEFAMLCEKLGINVWEVVEAAQSKPFGFKAFYPGPGVGGHCIPVDPLYLQWKSEQIGISSSFIQLSSKINQSMPAYAVSKMKEAMSRTSLKGACIYILGVTFKENVADIRESSALEMMKLLARDGAAISYYDPLIPNLQIRGQQLHSINPSREQLQLADCVVIAVNHKELPLQFIADHSTLIFDTRNAMKGLSGKARVVLLGGV